MKWNLKVLALVAMSLAAFSAVADDYFDDEDPDSCWAPFGTNLDGYLLDTTGKKKIASVEIRETRGIYPHIYPAENKEFRGRGALRVHGSKL